VPARNQLEAENVDRDQKRIDLVLASFNDYQAGQDLGLVAQLVERCLCKAEALGPNPSKSIETMHTLRTT
jgi:hypothetical protein